MNEFCGDAVMPVMFSRKASKMSWSTVSKVVLRPISAMNTPEFVSVADSVLFLTHRRAVSVLCHGL